MSKFKDIVNKDISTVFFNLDEFSEYHVIVDEAKGSIKKVRMIIDKLELIEREKAGKGEYQAGLYNESTILYIPLSDIGAKPKLGKVLKVDNKRYTIKDISDENSVLALTVESVKS